jgi:hypothetical protein
MATDHPGAPTSPDLALLLEDAARLDVEALDLDAIEEIVAAAVAPFADVLTPGALDEARIAAAVALVSATDLEQRVARHRAGRSDAGGASPESSAQVPEASGTRPKQSPARLLDAARRRRDGQGGKGAS